MTFQPRFTITNSIASTLTKIERARGFLEAAHLSRDWIKEMQNRALILEAHHTTHIEGAQLTLAQSEQLLSGKGVPGTDPDDVQELLNYRKAFEFVSHYFTEWKPITRDIILKIHELLVKRVRGDEASPGNYREKQNWIVDMKTNKAVYTPPPPKEVPGLMQELIQWLDEEQDIHPVILAGIAQFQLVHIHPFLDGNGRAARLISTLCLYRAGYDFKNLFTISEYYDKNRSAYYNAIQSVRENDMDMTDWLEYFCHGLATQMQEVKEKGKKVIQLDLLSRKFNLSDRQKTAMGFLEENPTITNSIYQEVNDVSRNTATNDLMDLVKKGILHRSGTGRGSYYELQK
ncbi:MAG: Fic family protein [Thermoplasmata archaeon]|nr:Fic family protein [Thermoplasmata archaeon]